MAGQEDESSERGNNRAMDRRSFYGDWNINRKLISFWFATYRFNILRMNYAKHVAPGLKAKQARDGMKDGATSSWCPEEKKYKGEGTGRRYEKNKKERRKYRAENT